jgi:hypothetical protein
MAIPNSLNTLYLLLEGNAAFSELPNSRQHFGGDVPPGSRGFDTGRSATTEDCVGKNGR